MKNIKIGINVWTLLTLPGNEEEIKVRIEGLGLDADKATRLVSDFKGSRPLCLGRVDWQYGFIAVSETQSLAFVEHCFLHEIGHVFARELGLDAKSELAANLLARLLSDVGCTITDKEGILCKTQAE